MAKKPKARKAPAKTDDESKQKEQSARFIKAAREIGVDESGKEFERAIKKIVPSKKTSSRGA
ncbi:hypothetical protein [Nitrobacter vulgaris]|uniref:hypothetical protein n=1 Tax=Nitrobacter vulgaris TaxID=29421 RepID=UPI0011179A9E|nr:hypothetical protein [Nitrobacter vulgaris]